EARRIRGNAEAEATRLLNEAHARDPRFFEFPRPLESYRSILDDRTTVVLSASSPLLRLLVKGPPTDGASEATADRTPDSPAGPGSVTLPRGGRDRRPESRAYPGDYSIPRVLPRDLGPARRACRAPARPGRGGERRAGAGPPRRRRRAALGSPAHRPGGRARS